MRFHGAPDGRPVFLHLLRIRFPISAWISILHRATGVVLVLLIPFAIALLDYSLGDEGFAVSRRFIETWWVRLGLLGLLWALLHHLVVGIRHLLLDLEWGIDKPMMLRTAWWSLLLPMGLTVAVAAGWWL